MSNYFKNIKDSFRTLSSGLKLTLSNLIDARTSRKPIGVADENYFDADKGIFTLQYPHESFPVPDNGRYRLHNEIDDCIVCDKCAKVCPVDCIDIEPIKAPETIGITSDGTPKRIHAAKFDIDMGKCCFCGLCTTVCPTECLTMTKVYDFSEFDVKDHNYEFSEMSLVEIAEKRKEAEESENLKIAQRAKIVSENKKIAAPDIDKSEPKETELSVKKSKPIFRPKAPKSKPVIKSTEEPSLTSISNPKPVFRPKPMVKKKPKESTENQETPIVKNESLIDKKGEETKQIQKPKFRPRPVVKRKPKDDSDAN